MVNSLGMRNGLSVRIPLLLPACCLIAGIVVGSCLSLPVPWYLLFLAAVVVALLLGRHELLQSLAILVCIVMLGALLVQRQQQSLAVEWPDEKGCYEAVVLSEPVEKPKTMAVDILLTDSRHKLKCYFEQDGRSRALRVGDGLRLCARIRPNADWHSGTFDYRRYLEIHGFTGTAYVAGRDWRKVSLSLAGLSRLERARLFFLKLRSRMLERFSAQGVGGEQYAVVAAMVLGDKSGLSGALKDVYSRTGGSHVLALSGLHLGIIYTLLSLLVVGRWRLLSQVLVMACVWAFVLLVGMPPSVVRAATMLTVYVLLSVGHRDRLSVNVLAFTAIVMLMASPLALFDVGFQLSFMAMFFILLFVPMLEGALPAGYLQSHRLMKWIWGMIGVSCAAQLGVAPMIAYYFGRLPVYFLLTNFVVVPAVTLILVLSAAVLLVPSVTWLLVWVVGALNGALYWLAGWPLACVDGLQPSLLQVVLAYVAIFAGYGLLRITGNKKGVL